MSTPYPSKFPHTQYGLTFAGKSDWVQYLKTKTEEVARAKGIPAGIMSGIAEQESSWAPGAINTDNKNKSTDAGLTQINSINWPRYGIKNANELVTDPLKSIEVGADILSKNLQARNGDINLAIADYNQGAGNTSAQLRDKKPPSVPVQKYVTHVLFRAAKYGAAYPTTGQIQKLGQQLNFVPNTRLALKAIGVDPEKFPALAAMSAQPAVATANGNPSLTLPSVQSPDDAAHQQQIAAIEQAAQQDQLNVDEESALAAGTHPEQSLALGPQAAPNPGAPPQPQQDLSLAPVEQTLAATPEDNLSIDDRIAAAFGPAPTTKDTKQLPKFVDNILDSVLAA